MDAEAILAAATAAWMGTMAHPRPVTLVAGDGTERAVVAVFQEAYRERDVQGVALTDAFPVVWLEDALARPLTDRDVVVVDGRTYAVETVLPEGGGLCRVDLRGPVS